MCEPLYLEINISQHIHHRRQLLSLWLLLYTVVCTRRLTAADTDTFYRALSELHSRLSLSCRCPRLGPAAHWAVNCCFSRAKVTAVMTCYNASLGAYTRNISTPCILNKSWSSEANAQLRARIVPCSQTLPVLTLLPTLLPAFSSISSYSSSTL